MIRIRTTRRLADEAKRTAELTEQRNAARADVASRIELARRSSALRDETFDRAATNYNARIRAVTAERDRARNWAVALEQQLARVTVERDAGTDIITGLADTTDTLIDDVERLTAETTRLLAEQARVAAGSLGGHDVAERLQATAAAADLPIGIDATPDDWHLAVKAAIEEIARRTQAQALRDLATHDPKAAARAGEAAADWAGRAEAL